MVYPTPLAGNPFQDETLRKAYKYCLELQAAPDQHLKPTYLVCARYLGHLLHQLHITEGLTGAAQFAKCIIEHAVAGGNDGMRQMAILYINYTVKTFRRASGPTPQPSIHSSRDFEDMREEYLETMQAGKLDHRAARKHALRRDNFRCLVTGDLDINALEDGLLVQPPGDCKVTYTQAAHILPGSLHNNIGEGSNKRHDLGGVWTVIKCFFPDAQLAEGLRDNNIHRLDNIMTLSQDVHSSFDDLKLWLKPVHPPVPHTYRTYGRHSFSIGANRTITFRCTDKLPPPNAQLLALHAVICEVAHMSGAAEYVEAIQRDADECHILAEDGSSAQLLEAVLALAAPMQ